MGSFKELHVRMNRIALAAAVASGLSLVVIAAPVVAQTAPAPATTPAASAPVANTSAQQAAAKAVLADFFHGMFAGDEKTLSNLYFPESYKDKTAALTMFSEIIAEQKLRAAVNNAFGAAGKSFDTGMGPDEVADFEKDMGNATVKVNDAGDSATIQMGASPTFVVVFKANKWMVDFDATQKNMGPLPSDKEVATINEKVSKYNQLATDVAAKKFAKVEDVTKEVEKIDAAAANAEPPATVPATKAG